MSCGAKHPKNREVCTRDAGHVGLHSNGGNVTWKHKPEEKQGAKPTADPFAPMPGQCDVEAAALAHSGTVFRGVMVGMRRRDVHVHPAADAFPMIDGPEFEALVEDISKHGVRRKPVLDADGNLVDGRNRMRACERLGIDTEFEHLSEGVDIVDYVLSTNVRRRHLNVSQLAMIAARLANAPRGRPSKTGHSGRISQQEAAERVGVNDRTVRRAKVVAESVVPEVVQAVDAGKVGVTGALEIAKLPPNKQREFFERVIKPSKGPVRDGKIRSLAKQEEKREVVRKINTGRVAPMPAGAFGVIYADYPWKYDNSDQHEGSRGHMGYPPMEMDQIIAHAREAATRAGKDCIIALWVTNLHIPNIGRVVEAYGAEHHTMVTWPKPRAGVGSWPRGQTEHLVIASIGAPVHTLNEISTLLPSWQPARPGEHSSKPAEVAELLAKHCAGPFLELFARDEQREGWTLWGAEVGKFASPEAA